VNNNFWEIVGDEFDSKLKRMTAVIVKEDDYALGFTNPSDWNSSGYCFNLSEKTCYDIPERFKIEFAVYSYPDFLKSAGKNSIVFNQCKYYPSLIKRNFRYSNLGVDCTDYLAQAVEGSLSWHVELESFAEGKLIDKQFYTILSSQNKFSVNIIENSVIELKFEDMVYYIKCKSDVALGLYNDEHQMRQSLSKGEVESVATNGYYLVLGHKVNLLPGTKMSIRYGLSGKSGALANKAFEADNLVERVSLKWNNWFNTLPFIGFEDENEKKAWYKCWWIIKLNYYSHPEWGYCITESLPVYKGIWQWAIPSVGWHSNQNTEYTSQWFKKAMDMLTNSQRKDGYITHAIYIDEKNPGEGWAKGVGTVQTPHLPWSALHYYHSSQDIDSLRRWYGHFKEYYDYLCETRDKVFLNLHLWGIINSFDTGLDTTPVFQKVTYGENGIKEDYCYPSIFAAERVRYEEGMGRIAELIGEDGQHWYKEAEITKAVMHKTLWDEGKKWYGVLHQDGTLDTRIGIDGMFPLVYHYVSKEQAALMETGFKRLLGSYGIRTVAPGEAGYREDIYWCGPAWPKSCSLGMEICRYYYKHLIPQARKSIVNMALSTASIWECYIVDNGEPAYSDFGFACTPCVSSNVGAGDIIGSLLISHGFGMYDIDTLLPLTEMNNFHWSGTRVTINRKDDEWIITVKPEELNKVDLKFMDSNCNVHVCKGDIGEKESKIFVLKVI